MAESWLQLSVTSRAENLDAVANFLVEKGSPGVVLKKNRVEGYFPRTAASGALRREVARFVGALSRLSPRGGNSSLAWRAVEGRDWQESWKRFIKPARIGKHFWVTPPWLEAPKFRRRKVITIEPGMAFGTGTHATTRGCLEFIESASAAVGKKKFSALDVGTGSGILATALAMLGAAPVFAVDNDPVAISVARDNLRANGVSDKVRLSDTSLAALRRRFDVVVANLTAETILELAVWLEKRTAKGGFLILSGILRKKERVVARRFAERFRVRSRKRTREWATLLLQRS